MNIVKTVRWLLIIPLLVLISGCNEDVPGLKPSGLNHEFNLSSDTVFNEYIDHYRNIIETSRIDLSGPGREKIIEANLPFEMRPITNTHLSKGILLIHGLFDSPYQMKALGRFFKEKGFVVRAILLPGHGTVPGDQIGMTLHEWQKAVDYGVNSFQKEVDTVSIAGFSTGGGLALLHTLENPGTIDSLFLFSPCFKVKTSLAWLAGPFSHIKTWLITRKNNDYTRYESFAANSGGQVYNLTEKVIRLMSDKEIDIPVFVALSSDDITVDSDYTIEFFINKVTSHKSRLKLYTGAHFTNPYKDKRIGTADVSDPSRNIISSSHSAIPISPDDEHYGENGDYRNCLHYFLKSDNFEKCRNTTHITLGEITPKNLSAGVVSRLTWNPKYNEMIESIDSFLDNNADN